MSQILNDPPGSQPGTSEQPRGRHPSPWRSPAWRPSSRGLLASSAAVALAAGLGLTAAGTFTARSADTPMIGYAAAPPATTVTAVLDRAAQTAAAQPAVTVAPSQYFYVKVKIAGVVPGKTIEEWIPQRIGKESEWKYDNLPSPGTTVLPGGGSNESLQPMTGMSIAEPDTPLAFPSYAYLQSLPTSPRQLLDYIEQQLHTVYTVPDVSFEAFYMIGQLLLGAVVPPQTAATLYRAAALIPGVEVIPDARDALGRHGIGIGLSAPARPSASMEWVFSTTTHQLIGIGSDQSMVELPSHKKLPPIVSAVVAKGVADTLGGTPTLVEQHP